MRSDALHLARRCEVAAIEAASVPGCPGRLRWCLSYTLPMGRKPLTRAELREQLRQQVELLMTYCTLFDGGNDLMAKPMATALRVLLHSNPNPKSSNRALLDQLHLRKGRWRNVSASGHPRDHRCTCTIIGISVSMTVASVQPLTSKNRTAACTPVLRSPKDAGVRRTPFATWWTEPVAFNSSTGRSLSRMDIVRHVADTDGGAHVDGAVDESYASLRDGSFLAVRADWGNDFVGIGFGGDRGAMIEGAHLAAVRTIAHETLLSLLDHAPDVFSREYVAEPALPKQGAASLTLG